MEAVHKNIKRLDPNCKNIHNLRLWSIFSFVNLIKTLGLAPSNTLFVSMVHVWKQLSTSTKIGVVFRVPNLTCKISCSRIFPTKLIVQTERAHPRESRKVNIWWVIWWFRLKTFYPIFFSLFHNWFFLDFYIFLPTKWICMVRNIFLANVVRI